MAAREKRDADASESEVRPGDKTVQEHETKEAEGLKCRECAESRRYAEGSVWCVHYGMIIREEHECTREGGRLREDGDQGGEMQGETEDQPGDGEGAA